MTAWWLGLPPAQARVGCGDHLHTLRWEAGELLAVDHADVEGERTLAALGGGRCTCVDVLDAWARHASDLLVLVLASRGPADRLTVESDWSGPARQHPGPRSGGGGSGWTAYAYAPGVHVAAGLDERAADLVRLFGLGGGLPERLAATVAAGWSGRPDDEVAAERARIHSVLFGRTALALQTWLAEPDLQVDVEMIAREEEPGLVRRDDGVVRAALPFAWVVEVWARGFATFGGRFCIGAETDDGRRWTLTTVGPDLRERRSVRLEL